MNLSPYAFAKVLSAAKGKVIPPQMVYNYVKKGYIAAQTNDLGKKFITPAEQERFLEKFLKVKEEEVKEA
jgi:hypothetical protein